MRGLFFLLLSVNSAFAVYLYFGPRGGEAQSCSSRSIPARSSCWAIRLRRGSGRNGGAGSGGVRGMGNILGNEWFAPRRRWRSWRSATR